MVLTRTITTGQKMSLTFSTQSVILLTSTTKHGKRMKKGSLVRINSSSDATLVGRCAIVLGCACYNDDVMRICLLNGSSVEVRYHKTNLDVIYENR